MKPSITILSLFHGHAEFVEACLGSLLASEPPGELEWLLGENGSMDRTPEVLARFASDARAKGWRAEVVGFGRNIGAVAGRNRLMERAGGELIVFMDSDVALRSRDWLGMLARRLEEDPRRGIVAPRLVYPRPPYQIQCAGCEVTRSGRVIFRGRGDPREDARWSEPAELKAATSACWMMPRSLQEELGPLDEHFSPLQFEDIAYCYRARAAGRPVLCAPEIEMYHCENVTSGRTAALNYRYITVRNGIRFARKWRGMIAAEGGPPDAEWGWKEIEPIRIEEVRELPVV